MAEEDEEEDAGPAVELGEHAPVEGAPLARAASRLTFPLQRSMIERREGDTTIRTPDGPRELAAVLEDVDVTYFESGDEFRAAVREEIGTGPVPTE